MILQLNPSIPVYLPHLKMQGYAIGWLDYSQEHNLYWIVALDNNEVWIFENDKIRMQKNITLGRI